MAKTEVKHITLGLVLGYVFGLLFILAGAVALVKSLVGGILVIVGALIIFPPFVKFIENKFNIKLSIWLRIIAFLILVGIGSNLAYSYDTPDLSFKETEASSITDVESQQKPIPKVMQPIKLSGIGQEATESFYLEKGLRRFKMTHMGDSNFIVWLYDSNGNKVELVVNEIGYYDGSRAFGIDYSGNYMLDVTAGGSWDITIT